MQTECPNYFLVIPSYILDDETVDDSTAILFGRIQSLTNVRGYCFASDEYLAKLTKTSVRTVQRRLQVLKSRRYLKIISKKTGLHWDRRIYLNFNYETTELSSRNDTHDVSKTSPVAEEQDKINNTNIKPPKGGKKPPPEFEFHGEFKNVKLTREQLESLRERVGDDDEVRDCIIDLDAYIQSQGKKYRCHYSTILTWIRKERRREKKKARYAPQERGLSEQAKANIALFDKAVKANEDQPGQTVHDFIRRFGNKFIQEKCSGKELFFDIAPDEFKTALLKMLKG